MIIFLMTQPWSWHTSDERGREGGDYDSFSF